MAGTHVIDAVQLGDNSDALKNFVLETNNDGTATLARGNKGATTQDILTVDSAGKVDFTNLSRTLGTSGSFSLYGGLKIQWGRVDILGASSVVVTYPTAFAAPAYAKSFNFQTGASASNILSCDVGSTTQFTIIANASITATIVWIAIGQG